MTDHAAPTPPASDEPQTPMWLPVLGAAIFLAVGLAWAIAPSASSQQKEASPPSSASAASTAATDAHRK